MRVPAIDQVLQDKKIIVCVGAGGVGKTTVSAALGLYAGVHLDKKTLIVTIDPAKRLADALGIKLGSKPKRIHKQAQVYAMMLDLEAAWTDMLHRLSPDEESIARIQNNRFYHHLSHDMAGSQEFVACEALYTLALEHDYDLIVLDTPPTVHALDFLDAPKRIISFLDQEAFHFILSQTKGASKLGLGFLGLAGRLASGVMDKFVSVEFLNELIAFLQVFKDLYSPLVKRARGFQDLLRSPDTSFCVVLAPQHHALSEAQELCSELSKRFLPLGALLANQVLEIEPAFSWPTKIPGLSDTQWKDLRGRLQQAHAEQTNRARLEANMLEDFRQKSPSETPMIQISKVWQGVQSIENLLEMFQR